MLASCVIARERLVHRSAEREGGSDRGNPARRAVPSEARDLEVPHCVRDDLFGVDCFATLAMTRRKKEEALKPSLGCPVKQNPA